MTTNHIDQLAEWWEGAETGPVLKGDLVIKRHPDGRYTIREAEKGWENTNYRILARAPKPAWHDAKAVIAHTDYCERQVWERDSLGWYGTGGDVANTEDLRDVTPLIEAKVTNEMVKRVFIALDPVLNRHLSMTKDDEEYVRYIVAAALGLDPV